MPTAPCGSSPDRYATTMAISSEPSCARHSASLETFPRRALVAATSAEALAISSSSTSAVVREKRLDATAKLAGSLEPGKVAGAGDQLEERTRDERRQRGRGAA